MVKKVNSELYHRHGVKKFSSNAVNDDEKVPYK